MALIIKGNIILMRREQSTKDEKNVGFIVDPHIPKPQNHA
jgi:hypothetical protein